MADIRANPTLIVVDNKATPPETEGTTKIKYLKDPEQELWLREPGTAWKEDLDHGDEQDRFEVTLKPGQVFTAGIFEKDHGPTSDRPNPLASLNVHAVLKKPEQRNLIKEDGGQVGGTWLDRAVTTNVETTIAFAGASRAQSATDNDGIPVLVNPDAGFVGSATAKKNHFFELMPLVPGHHYFLTAMVVDAAGNWDVLQREVDSRKRKLTVQFPKMHIHNDGDPSNYGEGEFWFRVFAGDDSNPQSPLQTFHLPEMDIDDWSETGRPYAVGFAYVELAPLTISPGRTAVWVNSTATEDDWPFGYEGAGALPGRKLSLPIGPAEKVSSSSILLDCPATTTGDDFHYKVDVTFAVEYLP